MRTISSVDIRQRLGNSWSNDELKNLLPGVGDVVVSKSFAFGYKYDWHNFVTIDGKTKSMSQVQRIDEEVRVKNAATSGKIPSREIVIDIGCYDDSRSEAEFVIEKAEAQYSGHNDRFFNGYKFIARKLSVDGLYDPNGELIQFYMMGGSDEIKEIRLVRKMQSIFV